MNATNDNYTHVTFYYEDGNKMTLNKFTHENIYADEAKKAERVEYIIRDLSRSNSGLSVEIISYLIEKVNILPHLLTMEFKEGDSFKARIPFSGLKAYKVHITRIFPSSCYSDITFLVYKVFGKHKRWWHEFMCTTEDMEFYIQYAKPKKVTPNL